MRSSRSLWPRRPRRSRRGRSTSAPERTCVGCRRKAPPDALDRVARTPAGDLEVGRRAPGRGAWLCSGSPACFARAVRRGALARVLRRPMPSDEVERLRARLYGVAPEGAQER